MPQRDAAILFDCGWASKMLLIAEASVYMLFRGCSLEHVKFEFKFESVVNTLKHI